MAVLTIYFLVEIVYRYHVRTFPRTSIDTPSRSSVSNFSSIHIRTCRDAGVCAIPCIFFCYSRCNPVLFHYRYAGTYIISCVFSMYSRVISYYSITPLSCAMTMKQESFFFFGFCCIFIDLRLLNSIVFVFF